MTATARTVIIEENGGAEALKLADWPIGEPAPARS